MMGEGRQMWAPTMIEMRAGATDLAITIMREVAQWCIEVGRPGFIHKLCVRRDFAGRNLSTKMVEHAVSECKKKTIDLVRLDTDFVNPRLCALYEGMGFIRAGRKRTNGRDCALYELRVSNFRPSWPHMKVG
jgi:GNAT superfamily N-acetyltransferase